LKSLANFAVRFVRVVAVEPKAMPQYEVGHLSTCRLDHDRQIGINPGGSKLMNQTQVGGGRNRPGESRRRTRLFDVLRDGFAHDLPR